LNEIIVGGALAGKTLVSFHILPLRAAAVQAPTPTTAAYLGREIKILNGKLLPRAQITSLSSKGE
jgi:hypothetical protein